MREHLYQSAHASWRDQETERTSCAPLSEGLLQAVDALAGKASRSAWIERSVRGSVQRALRRQRDENELRLLNEHADSLNRESADARAYQTPWDVE
jgi:hypothetical protein